MLSLLCIILYLLLTAVVLYKRLNKLLWVAASLALSLLFYVLPISNSVPIIIVVITLGVTVAFMIPFTRGEILTKAIYKLYKKILPKMSSTEREALDAGTVTWEADIFSGKPDWYQLLNVPVAQLSIEEKAFIEGPLEQLCAMIDDWDITHHRYDMPKEMWDFLKDNGFFAFIIPKQYGGLAFSPFAISKILSKLYGLSASVASTVGVPNSLGPAELLLKYGTEQQKNYYLPRLASGEEVPCFALTGLEAGSDAAAIPDTGVVCKREINGEQVLGINLNFYKRYITLAPVASLVGLAFKLSDPDKLLGDQVDYGITCALLPRDTENMKIGRRHFPVNQAFMNGVIEGNDVFISIDNIIGGAKMAGKGWRMLMECLATGRAVTLPASSVGGSLLCAHATGSYARVRKQFNVPIGQFEGVVEALAAIGGNTYLIDAALRLTMFYLNNKQSSAVAAAIVKYHVTERGRLVINHAMDVHGGKAIQMGPNNYLARAYQGQPIGITVEGANILTRSLIIFGQGAIRCHPHVFAEMIAVQKNDFKSFDKAIVGHIGFFCSNFIRTLWLGLSNSRFTQAPVRGASKRYYQIFSRYSAALAFVSDVAMFVLGGSLKRRETLSARLGDILSNLYLGSAVLKRFRDEGHQEEDIPLMEWSCRQLAYEIQESFHNFIRNFPVPILRTVLRFIVFPFGRLFSNPQDITGQQIAEILLNPSDARTRLIDCVYNPDTTKHSNGLLSKALQLAVICEPINKKIMKAVKAKVITGGNLFDRINAALQASIITQSEAEQMQEMHTLTLKVIMVDDFSDQELRPNHSKQ